MPDKTIAELAVMALGAIAAVWFVMAVTHSRMRDIGGPVCICDQCKIA